MNQIIEQIETTPSLCPTSSSCLSSSSSLDELTNESTVPSSPITIQLESWSSLMIDGEEHTLIPELFPTDCKPIHSKPVFPCDQELNDKIVLWRGSLLQLNVDAIVHPTNEHFERLTGFSDQLYRKCGPQLRKCLFNQIKSCKTGCVKITKSYALASPYLIHVACPKFQLKFKTASENALFRSYYNILLASKQAGFRTIALGPLTIPHHRFPEHESTRLGIRVVRRFLESNPDAFDLIVFTVETGHQLRLYNSTLKLYFPRDGCEERAQCYRLPENTGGPMGQPIIPERQIRIKESPVEKSHNLLSDKSEVTDSNTTASSPQNRFNVSQFDRSSENYEKNEKEEEDDLCQNSLLMSIGRSNFARMKECRDQMRQDRFQKIEQNLGKEIGQLSCRKSFIASPIITKASSEPVVDLQQRQRNNSINENIHQYHQHRHHHGHHHHHHHSQKSEQDRVLFEKIQRQLKFERLVRKAKLLERSDEHSCELREKLQKCIYISGYDHDGRPILTIIGKRFESSTMCNELTLCHVLNLLQQLIANGSNDGEFTILYYHNQVSKENRPDSTFMAQLHELLTTSHWNKLHRLYIVNCSVWSRLSVWWWQRFNSTKVIQNKIAFINGIGQLLAVINNGTESLPC